MDAIAVVVVVVVVVVLVVGGGGGATIESPAEALRGREYRSDDTATPPAVLPATLLVSGA
eukprot:1178746-Alexandrium_andersonii.AAC.1